MTKEEKNQVIDQLTEELTSNEIVYLADVSNLTVAQSGNLRRSCFKNDVSLKVVKNTLLKKAMEKVENKDWSEFHDLLKGNTSLMYSATASSPAKLIKEFRQKHDHPILKGAYIQESVYIGDELLSVLATLKSKNELIGDVIMLLQSPAKNVISGLQSAAATLTGLLKALEEREDAISDVAKEASAQSEETKEKESGIESDTNVQRAAEQPVDASADNKEDAASEEAVEESESEEGQPEISEEDNNNESEKSEDNEVQKENDNKEKD